MNPLLNFAIESLVIVISVIIPNVDFGHTAPA
jgi:hypothetical protein